MSTRVWIAIAAVSALVCQPEASMAMGRPGAPTPQNAEEAYRFSDVVFTGRVLSIEPHGGNQDDYVAQVKVSRAWKTGEGIPDVIGVTVGTDWLARPNLKVGEEYLFYVNRMYFGVGEHGESVPYRHLRGNGVAERVLPLSKAAKDLTYLSQYPGSAAFGG